jgi:hypothetical protein
MKARALPILASLALVLSFPLAAQQPEEPYDPATEPTVHQPLTEPKIQEPEPQAQDPGLEAEPQTQDPAALDAEKEPMEAEGVGVGQDTEYGADEALPQTASPLALLALLGLGGAGAAAGVRALRRRR